MNREEAIEFLESLDYCMTHLVPQERKSAKAKLTCPECDQEENRRREAKVSMAIGLIRGAAMTPPASSTEWTRCDFSPPPINERVWLSVEGFRERERGKAGGKERYVMNSKPKFWKRFALAGAQQGEER